jgi:hypothetical protein
MKSISKMVEVGKEKSRACQAIYSQSMKSNIGGTLTQHDNQLGAVTGYHVYPRGHAW